MQRKKRILDHLLALVGYSPGILRLFPEFFKMLATIFILAVVAFALQHAVLSLLYLSGINWRSAACLVPAAEKWQPQRLPDRKQENLLQRSIGRGLRPCHSATLNPCAPGGQSPRPAPGPAGASPPPGRALASRGAGCTGLGGSVTRGRRKIRVRSVARRRAMGMIASLLVSPGQQKELTTSFLQGEQAS